MPDLPRTDLPEMQMRRQRGSALQGGDVTRLAIVIGGLAQVGSPGTELEFAL